MKNQEKSKYLLTNDTPFKDVCETARRLEVFAARPMETGRTFLLYETCGSKSHEKDNCHASPKQKGNYNKRFSDRTSYDKRRSLRSKSPFRRNNSPFKKGIGEWEESNEKKFYNQRAAHQLHRGQRNPIGQYNSNRSNYRTLSRSPFRRQSRSPFRGRSRSPYRRESGSPKFEQRYSRSPFRRNFIYNNGRRDSPYYNNYQYRSRSGSRNRFTSSGGRTYYRSPKQPRGRRVHFYDYE